MENNKRTYSRESIKKLKADEGEEPEMRDIIFGERIIRCPIPAKVSLFPNNPQYSNPKFQFRTQQPHSMSSMSISVPQQSQPQQPQQSSSAKVKVEIDSQSYSSLDPGRMLNDTVVEFYMNYLMQNLSPGKRDRIHLFSTFFYSKLKKLTQSSKETDANQSIRRWDKNVKVFDKDYLVVPICDSRHWLLVIICFAHKAPANDDPIVINDIRPVKADTSQAACLIIFDSLGYKYMSKFTDPIRNFLNLRWRYERPNDEERNFKDRNAFRELAAKVPRQRNVYDCGIYLLHYFEQFLQNPLNAYVMIKELRDLQVYWQVDTRQKRNLIRSLVCQAETTSNELLSETI